MRLSEHGRSFNSSAIGPMPITPSAQLSWGYSLLLTGLTCLFCLAMSFNGAAQESPPSGSSTNAQMQSWNFHIQNTDIVQGYPAFSAQVFRATKPAQRR